jgi:hypothetical protein
MKSYASDGWAVVLTDESNIVLGGTRNGNHNTELRT